MSDALTGPERPERAPRRPDAGVRWSPGLDAGPGRERARRTGRFDRTAVLHAFAGG